MKVREAMTSNLRTCEPRTSLRTVAVMMAEENCAAIPVTAAGKLIGIITDRDVTCRGLASGVDALNLPVSSFMTSPVLTLDPNDELSRAVYLMEENRIHHLPVIAGDGTLVGMVAQSDLGKRMSDREFGWLARRTSIPPIEWSSGDGLVRRECAPK